MSSASGDTGCEAWKFRPRIKQVFKSSDIGQNRDGVRVPGSGRGNKGPGCYLWRVSIPASALVRRRRSTEDHHQCLPGLKRPCALAAVLGFQAEHDDICGMNAIFPRCSDSTLSVCKVVCKLNRMGIRRIDFPPSDRAIPS